MVKSVILILLLSMGMVPLDEFKTYCLDNHTLIKEYKWVENGTLQNVTVYKYCNLGCEEGRCTGEFIKFLPNTFTITIIIGLGVILLLIYKLVRL